MTVIEFLKREKINSSLIEGIMEFRASHPVREEDGAGYPVPRYLYYGRDVWGAGRCSSFVRPESASHRGRRQRKESITGPESGGSVCGRPVWDISFTLTWMRPA